MTVTEQDYDPADGEQGLTSVEYIPGEFADRLPKEEVHEEYAPA